MRHGNLYVLLAMLIIVATNSSALALEEKKVNDMIVHDSSNPKLITTFVEDVVSLLPSEMVQALEPHFEVLNRNAGFNVRDDYWRSKVISRDDFKKRLEAIPTKDGNELASQLGGTVKHVFEIALSTNSHDVLKEGLKKNLREVPSRWSNGIFTVVYEGYNGQSLDNILGTLYEYNKRQKMTLYPDLVKTTADLWSAVWQRGGGKTELVAKSFVRKPTDFNFWKNPGSGYTPSYSRKR